MQVNEGLETFINTRIADAEGAAQNKTQCI